MWDVVVVCKPLLTEDGNEQEHKFLSLTEEEAQSILRVLWARNGRKGEKQRRKRREKGGVGEETRQRRGIYI